VLVRIVTRVSDAADMAAGWAGMLLLGLMFIIVVLQVFCRYVLNNALSWPEELSQPLMVWAAFLGASMGLKRRMHIGMTLVIELFSPLVRGIFQLAIEVLILIFTLAMVRYGWSISVFAGSRQLSPYLNIPYFYFYSSITAGGVLLLVQLGKLILDDLIFLIKVCKRS
jgi:TRAP-type C4-dicarboxylate transport system permease small subunit